MKNMNTLPEKKLSTIHVMTVYWHDSFDYFPLTFEFQFIDIS